MNGLRVALVLLLLLGAGHAVAKEHWRVHDFLVFDAEPTTARPGQETRVPVRAAHRCPAEGEVEFFVGQGPWWLNASHPTPSNWGPCVDDFAFADGILVVQLDPNAQAGPTGLGVAAVWKQEVSKGGGVPLRVSYVARAAVETQTERFVNPGRSVEVIANVTLRANGVTHLLLGHDFPQSWQVDSPSAVGVPWKNGTTEVPWKMRVLFPRGAPSETVVNLHALPLDNLTRQSQGASGIATLTLRTPPVAPPSAPPARPPSDPPPAVTPPPPDAADDPPARTLNPALLVGGAVAVVGVAALWWLRR